jgi:3-oxoacyl-[acyl-carrier-protein] synthase III
MKAKLIHVVSFMPEKIIKNEEYLRLLIEENPQLFEKDSLFDNPFFKGVEERRFASPDYSSADLGERVLKKLLDETNTKAEEVDLIICSCMFNDTFWPGIGTSVQHRVGAKNASILHIDTSCCSFISGLNTASAYIKSGQYRTVAVLSVTNFISRLKEFQKSPRSFVLGDGSIAALMQAGDEHSIQSVCEQSFGQNYGLMRFEPDLMEGVFYDYWERGCGPITVNFTKESINKIRKNAIQIVPKMIGLCLKKGNISSEEIDCFITHQPNDFFINQWRKKLGISDDRDRKSVV